MVIFAGIDGGGTRTTLVLADEAGRELARRTGPAGIVDPRQPAASAHTLLALLAEARAGLGEGERLGGLCAGLAGVGHPAERDVVQRTLEEAGVAERVLVVGDGETALEGAFEGGPGVLIIAGTGSNAYGRGEDGRTARCGGWGMIVGDEGSGYWIGRTALQRALRADDGRGPPSRLLDAVLAELALPGPTAVPPWVGRAEKGEVAALVPLVFRLAEEGDAVAGALLDEAADGVVAHAAALRDRLGPWRHEVPVVLRGGVAQNPDFGARIERALRRAGAGFDLREPLGDAVAGALRLARGRVASAV